VVPVSTNMCAALQGAAHDGFHDGRGATFALVITSFRLWAVDQKLETVRRTLPGTGKPLRTLGVAAFLLICAKLAVAQKVEPPAATGREQTSVLAFLPPPISHEHLTTKEKFQIYAHRNYGPQNFMLPAVGAGFLMLHPPSHYPHDWKDGGGAFGRWYEEQIAAATANRTAELLTQVAWHEDPRYVPSGSDNAVMRILHAVAFTFVDETDSGRNTVAFSNFAGAAAGGFVGMALLPSGYNDTRHAEQRALRGLATVAVRNVVTEFRPQWAPVLRKIRVPSILPEWWTPKHPSHP
jgi:hypothetical protein